MWAEKQKIKAQTHITSAKVHGCAPFGLIMRGQTQKSLKFHSMAVNSPWSMVRESVWPTFKHVPQWNGGFSYSAAPPPPHHLSRWHFNRQKVCLLPTQKHKLFFLLICITPQVAFCFDLLIKNEDEMNIFTTFLQKQRMRWNKLQYYHLQSHRYTLIWPFRVKLQRSPIFLGTKAPLAACQFS